MNKLTRIEQNKIRLWFDDHKKYWKDLETFADTKAEEWQCEPEVIWDEMFNVPKKRKWVTSRISLKKKLIRNGYQHQ